MTNLIFHVHVSAFNMEASDRDGTLDASSKKQLEKALLLERADFTH
ncbi:MULTISPECIES: hypothetical protein [unclassified Bradyrhizobium]|nr:MULTISPECIES: hypothetical protein [unclassified Bradyrhizobium]UPJ26506.1 hypothetical protein IVB54_33290 [Bradyrhizobium sp. CW1]UPK20397.1 hypothetical protein IVA73_04600 [Bradyrhizobium sp. 131]